jgi:hypothetical protein
MNIANKWGIMAALMALLMVAPVYAADNGTEFGIEDDLTVLGSTGTWADPDAEVKGFSVFGPVAGPQNITAAPGNVAIRGNLQADATAYFGSSVTIAGYGVFQSTVTMVEGNLKYGAGAVGKVMKSNGNGFVYWGDDNTGSSALLGTAHRIRVEDAAGTGLADSILLQNAAATGITVQTAALGAASMTVTGAFGVQGYGNFLSTVSFLNNAGETTNIYMNNAAANVGRVLKASSNGFLYWGTDATGLATLGTARRIQMVNDAQNGLINSMFIQNALDTNITVMSGSSMTVNDLLALNDVAMKAKLSVDGAATFVSSVTAKGSVQLGDTPGTDEVAVNMAAGDARATGALNVAGDTASGAFVAKFYSGADMAAWIKKK